ncbi:MAG: hypothetical protein ABR615_06780 [Pseudonocardiaceae bacterium]
MHIRPPAAGWVHPVDELLSLVKRTGYGFRHVSALYAGAVIVPILLASAIGLSVRAGGVRR